MLGNSLVRYLASLLCIIGCYLTYQTLLVPFIDGEQVAVVNSARQEIAHADPKAGLEQLFAPNAWELKPCKVVDTRQGKLIFQELEKLEDGQVKITPLTMVVGLNSSAKNKTNDKDGGNEQPFVIRAAKGATLKFDQPFSLTGGIGKIETGIVEGDVAIYRLASDPNNDDSIEIETQNIELTEDTIYTLSDVAFRFGSSQGRGRHLSLTLADEGTSNDLPIKSMELAHVEYLHIDRRPARKRNLLDPLDARGAGSFEPQTALTTSNQLNQPQVDALGSIDVTCDGNFLLDMENLVASFKNHVRVVSVDSGDQLECDELWLYLKEKQTVDSAAIPNDEKSNFEIERIVALGSPARLTANRQNGIAEAEHLQFDLSENRVVLRGNQPVQVRRDGQHIIAREVEYLINEDGSLGNTLAIGPGEIVQNPQNHIEITPSDFSGLPQNGNAKTRRGFRCNWKGNLTIAADGNKKLISFTKRTDVQFDDESRLAGDQIQFWLLETSSRETPDSKPKWRLDPYQLIAQGNVIVESPKLDGRANKITTHWPSPTVAKTFRVKQRPVYVSLRPAYTQQDSFRPMPGVDSKTIQIQANDWQQEAANAKLSFAGDTVDIQIAQNSTSPDSEGQNQDDFNIEEVIVSGGVVIKQTKPGSNEQSLEIHGDSLKAVQVGPDLFRISILGREQAYANANGIKLFGKQINLDQKYNRLWIDGPGRMNLDSSAQKQNTLSGQQDSTPQATDILWNGGMVFDGETFYVEDNVRTQSTRIDPEGQTTEVQTISAALNARLNQMIDFQNQDQPREQKVELENIVLAGSVDQSARVFSNVSTGSQAPAKNLTIQIQQRDRQNKILGIQLIQVPDAVVNSKTGDVSCTGPGIVQGTQPAGSSRAAFSNASTSSSQSSPAQVPDLKSKMPFEFVQVKFEKSLEGNINQNEMEFIGSVRTVFSPVQTWQSTVDADDNNVKSPQSVRLLCDRLQLVRWAPKNATEPKVEMIASGNAEALGQRFRAKAHRIRYNQLTENVFLESSARRDSEIYYQRVGNPTQDKLTGETIRYNLRDNSAQVDRLNEIDITHQGPLLDRDK